ncbi:MAG: CCA tRNA nucleotidyltransferase [Hyphomicrobiales bacterium]|nr:CCA tRNA nucleotidyltransferase [Hyphomicrobiales bacterium]
MSAASIAGAEWLQGADLQRLLAALNANGEEARIVGGAVRNALLGQAVADVDVATTTLPEETVRRAERAGFRTVPTGIEHGTVTVVAGGKGYEVTTLRADAETDGRRAKVMFGRDWRADAERRDFTINALYAEADGTVIDLVGGLADLESGTLRFIGDAETRIKEDYLRILRFFRFFAWYGTGRPDAEGLKACARLKDGLERLSAERVWAELKKLLSAPDPSRALLWMRQASVLTKALPESEKWGIDAIHGLVAAERDLGWEVDAMLRVEAMVPPDGERLKVLADRLKLSKSEKDRLVSWANAPKLAANATEKSLARALYRSGQQPVVARLKLSLASARARAMTDNDALIEAGGYAKLLQFAQKWQKPQFPLKGADLEAIGVPSGPEMGNLLKQLEAEWIEESFKPDREALLARAGRAIAQG